MLQLVYISSARLSSKTDVHVILSKSRANNRADSISGLLYFDGVRFLQALEGPEDAVDAAFDRIKGDPRHSGLVLLSRRGIEEREFGDWAMAHRTPADDVDSFVARIERLLEKASPNVRATFASFAGLRRAA